MREEALADLVGAGAHLRIVYAQDGMWATSGRALWRERSSPTRFIVVEHEDSRHKR